MAIIQIDKSNIDREHICCAIGNDKINREHAESKKNWLRERFDEGLVFKRLDERGKVFIEYMPIENAWKPVIGHNLMIINCLWVSGKYKGKGYSSGLLDTCIEDCKSKGIDGIAVVTSGKVRPFLTDKKFIIKKGFVTVDQVDPDFELLLLELNENAQQPRFTDSVRIGDCKNKTGFTFIFSNQCPFMEKYMTLLTDITDDRGFYSQVIKIGSSAEAKETGSPFGTYGMYYNGKFVTHELFSEKKLGKYIDAL